MSNIDFSNLEAKVVLIEDALPEYQRSIDFFYLEQLVPLNATIYIMERILQFPFDLFGEPEGSLFFRLVLDNFYQAGLLTITRLATDTKGDLSTLVQFKNWVCKKVRPEYRIEFQHYLRRTRFDKATKAMLQKAKKLRNYRVAHIKRDYRITEQDQLDSEELKVLRDSLNSILDIVSFNVERLMVPTQYSSRVIHPKGTDSRSDIEKILDAIARESPILNLPENNPDHWSVFRKRLSEQQLETLNKYRTKLNLREV